MPDSRTTFAKFIVDEQRRAANPQPELASLLHAVQEACKLIALTASRGALSALGPVVTGVNAAGDEQKPLDIAANAIMVATCEWGGDLAGMVSEEMDEPYHIPKPFPRGKYLLVFDPLDGSSNAESSMPMGSIFSVLRCPDSVVEPARQDFLQPGTAQVAAGYALYGSATMLVLSLGAGVHGFTLDREIGAFVLTHPDMAIPKTAREFAINVSNERFWEPPVRRYVQECIEGQSGARAASFNMRWMGAMVAEVHRILVRGGLYMYPLGSKDPKRPARLRLLYEANPMAMLVEQAGGRATTGRQRILSLAPTSIHQCVPVILGSAEEVERIERYHAEHDRGEEPVFNTPLFNARSLFRTA